MTTADNSVIWFVLPLLPAIGGSTFHFQTARQVLRRLKAASLAVRSGRCTRIHFLCIDMQWQTTTYCSVPGMIFFELIQDVKMPITADQASRTPNSQATHIHWGASSLPGSGKNCPGDQWRGWCDTNGTMSMSHTNGVTHERKGHVTSKWQCCDRPWLSCSDPGRVKPKSPRFLKCESMSRCQVVRLGFFKLNQIEGFSWCRCGSASQIGHQIDFKTSWYSIIICKDWGSPTLVQTYPLSLSFPRAPNQRQLAAPNALEVKVAVLRSFRSQRSAVLPNSISQAISRQIAAWKQCAEKAKRSTETNKVTLTYGTFRIDLVSAMSKQHFATCEQWEMVSCPIATCHWPL